MFIVYPILWNDLLKIWNSNANDEMLLSFSFQRTGLTHSAQRKGYDSVFWRKNGRYADNLNLYLACWVTLSADDILKYFPLFPSK